MSAEPNTIRSAVANPDAGKEEILTKDFINVGNVALGPSCPADLQLEHFKHNLQRMQTRFGYTLS